MRKSWYLFILFALLTITGCALFEPKVNESGQPYTDIENYLKMTGGALQRYGGLIPGWGAIAERIGELLILIGGGITSVVMVRRRGGALDAVIKGVNTAVKVHDKAQAAIREELKQKMKLEDYNDLILKLNKVESIKNIIQEVVDDINPSAEAFLHKRVKKIRDVKV